MESSERETPSFHQQQHFNLEEEDITVQLPSRIRETHANNNNADRGPHQLRSNYRLPRNTPQTEYASYYEQQQQPPPPITRNRGGQQEGRRLSFGPTTSRSIPANSHSKGHHHKQGYRINHHGAALQYLHPAVSGTSSIFHPSREGSSNNDTNDHHLNNNLILHGGQDSTFSQPQGIISAVRNAVIENRHRFIDVLAGKRTTRNYNTKHRKSSTLSSPSTFDILFQRFVYLLPTFIIICIALLASSSHLDKASKHPEFTWNPDRRLNNRQCVLNLFVEKQKGDEFNPDYKEIKPDSKNPDGTPMKFQLPPEIEEGTYRTKGQVKLIARFIGSVADSFRPNIETQQHLVFAGCRDGGHLAELALKYWPARGEFRTQVHILADDNNHNEKDSDIARGLLQHRNLKIPKTVEQIENLALDYGSLSKIEERFQNHPRATNVHIYDSKGQKAGLIPSDIDDDDVIELRHEEMFGTSIGDDDDDFENDNDESSSTYSLEEIEDDSILSHDGGTNYISLKKLLGPHLQRGLDGNKRTSETEHVIPYFHVDGRSADHQFEILSSARPLLEDNTIVILGIEHSPDMDIYRLIDFFNTVHYKTFFLGLRQLARIDHLCPEILDQVIAHEYITPKKPNAFRRALQMLKVIDHDEDIAMVHPHEENHLKYPPFFIAIPRGRIMKEEMTIQHMYDLFGGLGGGGQIKTANDR